MTFRRPLMLASALALGAAAFPAILSAQGGGGGGRGGSQEPPKNLQVLPKDMPRPQVSAIMNTFTAALGVNCAYCHTAAPTAAGAAPAGPAAAGDIPPPAAEPAQRARETLIHALFSHNDFVTIR